MHVNFVAVVADYPGEPAAGKTVLATLLQCKSSVAAFKAAPSSCAAGRTAVHVVAQKRVSKKQQVGALRCRRGGGAGAQAAQPLTCHPCNRMAPWAAWAVSSVHAQAIHSFANPAQRVAVCSSWAHGLLRPHPPRPPLQVILVQDVPGLGAEGSLKSVPVGYWRNYLQPQGLAAFAHAQAPGQPGMMPRPGISGGATSPSSVTNRGQR